MTSSPEVPGSPPRSTAGTARMLAACEFSAVVRDAFARRGWDAWSCDLLPSENGGQHIQGDVFEHLDDGWDLLLFFWPCTNMAVSGARWFKEKREAQARDIAAFKRLMEQDQIPRIAGENPIGVLSSQYRKPDQIIQPWQFGHGEVKATCLWLKNLPKLTPTNIVEGRHARVHREPPGADRWKNRSRTLVGIGDAMADQWGDNRGTHSVAKATRAGTQRSCDPDGCPEPNTPTPKRPENSERAA